MATRRNSLTRLPQFTCADTDPSCIPAGLFTVERAAGSCNVVSVVVDCCRDGVANSKLSFQQGENGSLLLLPDESQNVTNDPESSTGDRVFLALHPPAKTAVGPSSVPMLTIGDSLDR